LEEISLCDFSMLSRTDLGPTQPPIQCVEGALSMGVKRPERETDHSPPSSAEVKECVELYLHSPIRLHGLVLRLKKRRCRRCDEELILVAVFVLNDLMCETFVPQLFVSAMR
jgi:hypothetical protein